MTDQAEKKHSAFWGVMVIAGTVIGGGMFALPVDLAGAWFFWGAFILIIVLTYAYISANGAIISETISMNLGYHANPRIVGICTAIFVASVLWISSLAASR
ncbi:tryptophan permease, partial [Escherichia coli]